MDKPKVAFISGANRGIGFEVAKKLGEHGVTVILGVRDLTQGQEAEQILSKQGIVAHAIHYDAQDDHSAQQVADYFSQHYGRLDILINNAGIAIEPWLGQGTASSVRPEILKQVFQTNLFGVILLTQSLLPLIKKSAAGRIVNMSSILGSLTLHAMPDSPIVAVKTFAYNASKTALNAFTVHLAFELNDTAIKVNSAHPGWVRTALGGPDAPMAVEDSYKTAVYLALLDADGPNGGFFHEHDKLPW